MARKISEPAHIPDLPCDLQGHSPVPETPGSENRDHRGDCYAGRRGTMRGRRSGNGHGAPWVRPRTPGHGCGVSVVGGEGVMERAASDGGVARDRGRTGKQGVARAQLGRAHGPPNRRLRRRPCVCSLQRHASASPPIASRPGSPGPARADVTDSRRALAPALTRVGSAQWPNTPLAGDADPSVFPRCSKGARSPLSARLREFRGIRTRRDFSLPRG